MMLAPAVWCVANAVLVASRPAWDNAGRFDVAVYGATPAGITAAVAAARMGRNVTLLAPSMHIGGMVGGGLSHTDIIRPDDIDNRLLIGGVAREFFELNTAWYHGMGDDHIDPSGHVVAPQMIWDVEPHVATILFHRMLDAANVTVVLNATLATATVAKQRSPGNRIEAIRDHSGRQFAAAMWVDATYEGDLLASAGVSFALGRESAAEYNESLAGFTGGSNPQFHGHIDPYDSSGALLPLVDSIPSTLAVGDKDGAVSSYTFRLCITTDPANQVPFQPPAGYNRSDWELVRRVLESETGHGAAEWVSSSGLVKRPPLPGGKQKYDMNSGGPLGTDFVGNMHGSLPAAAWAEADQDTRALMLQQHKDYVQGLLWFQHSEYGRYNGTGLCKDEFADTGNWPPQLYVREARRLRGQSVVGQRDVVKQEDIGVEAVGLGGYVFDTHTARRYACTPGSPPSRVAQCTAPGGRGGSVPPGTSGYAWDESHMVSDPGLFQLPRSLLLPQRAEATNLVVPTAVSASHVAFSSIRMEPQWMVLGHAAGVLVSLALALPGIGAPVVAAPAVHDVPAAQLNEALRAQGAMLDTPQIIQSSSCVLNRCVPQDAGGTRQKCQFCNFLAENEWLASLSDFAPIDHTSANVTALRSTALRKALAPDADNDLPVAAGYSCGRVYLQSFRGVWICSVSMPSPPPPPPPTPAEGVWFAWVPMFNYSEHSLTITAMQPGSLLKRVWSIPSGKLPPRSVCRVVKAAVLKLGQPATTIGRGNDVYFQVELAAGQVCPIE